jgi:hypothetical protein
MAFTNHFLPGSISAQSPLAPCTATTRARRPLLIQILRLHSNAAQAPHLHLTLHSVPILDPRSHWLLTPCSCLPSLMNLINSTRHPTGSCFWDPGAQNSATHEKMVHSVSHGAFYLSFMVYLVSHVASALQHLLFFDPQAALLPLS